MGGTIKEGKGNGNKYARTGNAVFGIKRNYIQLKSQIMQFDKLDSKPFWTIFFRWNIAKPRRNTAGINRIDFDSSDEPIRKISMLHTICSSFSNNIHGSNNQITPLAAYLGNWKGVESRKKNTQRKKDIISKKHARELRKILFKNFTNVISAPSDRLSEYLRKYVKQIIRAQNIPISSVKDARASINNLRNWDWKTKKYSINVKQIYFP